MLEAKQFFLSETAVRTFAGAARERNYIPPYRFLLVSHLEDECFEALPKFRQILDGYMAITIQSHDLQNLNNCVNFTDVNEL